MSGALTEHEVKVLADHFHERTSLGTGTAGALETAKCQIALRILMAGSWHRLLVILREEHVFLEAIRKAAKKPG